jgi:IS5 family transposase
LPRSYNLSDEALCERWVENPYFQHFCGEEFFQHRLVFDRSSLTRWRQRMGEQKLQALLQESLAVATRTEALRRTTPASLSATTPDKRSAISISRKSPVGAQRPSCSPKTRRGVLRFH